MNSFSHFKCPMHDSPFYSCCISFYFSFEFSRKFFFFLFFFLFFPSYFTFLLSNFVGSFAFSSCSLFCSVYFPFDSRIKRIHDAFQFPLHKVYRLSSLDCKGFFLLCTGINFQVLCFKIIGSFVQISF